MHKVISVNLTRLPLLLYLPLIFICFSSTLFIYIPVPSCLSFFPFSCKPRTLSSLFVFLLYFYHIRYPSPFFITSRYPLLFHLPPLFLYALSLSTSLLPSIFISLSPSSLFFPLCPNTLLYHPLSSCLSSSLFFPPLSPPPPLRPNHDVGQVTSSRH